MSPPAATPFEANRDSRLCHPVSLALLLVEASKTTNRRPGQRFIANRLPYHINSLLRFPGLPITGSPAAAGLVSSPAGAGAVVPPLRAPFYLHLSPAPHGHSAGQRSFSRGARQTWQPQLIRRSLPRPGRVYFAFTEYFRSLSISRSFLPRLCCHDVMSLGLPMPPSITHTESVGAGTEQTTNRFIR
ncbi:hypothetical protein M441DRAFT_263293 [Trichoderma asperellum CBS 433.97]|uniref:Uncharacterized protein n=1 Tax=Trichoderma asperellum (strain ATCC 204424 / CBS 433.97 / NBRC 101777) TaxID=1042311 RepID=A0A2T3YXF8_TRIA4|nr:hypothetical protein M441DRAFT_263293 [Trichoderma asperellum CBS 433.97]PTB37204.1 hypothetical protein M441DRAFT_263293 [Trichoderma asperellum CBS 433.97]